MIDENSMTKAKLIKIIENFFNLEPGEVSDEMGPSDIDGWDSIAYVSLVIEIEQSFGIEIPIEETSTIGNIGDLARLVAAKRGQLNA